MEAVFGPVVAKLLSYGGGYLLAGIVIAYFILERSRWIKKEKDLVDSKDKLNDRMFSLAVQQTQVQMHTASVLTSTDKTLDNVRATVNILADRRSRD